jgi:hypothetical protein
LCYKYGSGYPHNTNEIQSHERKWNCPTKEHGHRREGSKDSEVPVSAQAWLRIELFSPNQHLAGPVPEVRREK